MRMCGVVRGSLVAAVITAGTLGFGGQVFAATTPSSAAVGTASADAWENVVSADMCVGGGGFVQRDIDSWPVQRWCVGGWFGGWAVV